MGFRINTNVVSLATQRTLSKNANAKADSISKLSTGQRIVKAADDAAGLAISEKLRSQIRSLNQAERNANDGISLIQTAEGAMNEISSIITRLRELSIQSASDTVGDSERSFTDMEYQNLKQEIERISQVTEFNVKKLLDGSGDKYDFQIGINNDQFQDRLQFDAAASNTTLDSLSMNDLNVSNKQSAQSSLGILDSALTKISGQRARLGAVQNRLVSTTTNLQVTTENLSAANSRIRDTDYAAESAQNVQQSILTEAGTAVLAQANVMGQNALKLIG